MKYLRSVQKVRLKQVRDGRVKFRVEQICGPTEVYQAVRPFYRGADREVLSVLCLDSRNQPVAFNVVTMGNLNTTRTRPAEILKPAILSNALSIVLVHNHPSGDLQPSPDDIQFTRSMAKACDLVGITLYDHLIISDTGFVSLKEASHI